MAEMLKFGTDLSFYERLEDKKDAEDLAGRIEVYQTARKNIGDKEKEVYLRLADLYKCAELFDTSVKYLYKYLDRASNKEETVTAYTLLGNGYYYLANDKVSNYYFNKAFVLGGALDPDLIDDSVLEFFTKSKDKAADYKIVYPPEDVDYNDLLDEAKDLFIAGNLKESFALYEQVPEKSPFYAEARSEMAVAEFLHGDAEKGINLAREAYRADPENVFAACNLSSMFYSKGDYVNARKYYDKAMAIESDNLEDIFKKAMASCEEKEHKKALELLAILLDDKPYDTHYTFLSGMAYLNLGNLTAAREYFHAAYALKPFDAVYKYYVKLTDEKIELNLDGKPNDYPYFTQLPEKETDKRVKLISKLAEKTPRELNLKLKDPEVSDAILWAFSAGDSEVQKTSVYILAAAGGKYNKVIKDLLIEVGISDYIKRIILTVLVINGVGGKVGLVIGNIYQKIKIPALSEEFPDEFLYAYAGCVSVLAPVGVDDFSKLVKAASNVYEAVKTSKERVDGAMLSALMCCKSGYPIVSGTNETAKLFRVKKDRLEKFLCEFFNGDNKSGFSEPGTTDKQDKNS